MTSTNWLWATSAALLGGLLTGCGGGGNESLAQPNGTPLISGVPISTVQVDNAYSFTPAATDPDSQPLTFSISNMPSWASFNTSTGMLSGAPTSTSIGSFGGITISVSDGTGSMALPGFSIEVVAKAAQDSAALSWTAPTQNTDGTPITGLAGYRVFQGTSADALNDMTQLPGAATISFTVSHLAPGIHYFAVASYSVAGDEGPRSEIRSKVIL